MTAPQLPAADRLLLSRERLRQALHGAAPSPSQGAAAPAAISPGATIALAALRLWWQRHPWRTTAGVLNEAATQLLLPQAQRHPWRLVGLAALAGGVLVAVRPWRWLGRPTLVAALGPLLVLGAKAALKAQPPPQD